MERLIKDNLIDRRFVLRQFKSEQNGVGPIARGLEMRLTEKKRQGSYLACGIT